MAEVDISNGEVRFTVSGSDDMAATLVEQCAAAFAENAGIWLHETTQTERDVEPRPRLRWWPAATTRVTVTFDGDELPPEARAVASAVQRPIAPEV